jgi:hypothetical protein
MKLNKLFIMIFSLMLLVSCEKETIGVSRVTYFCNLELKGNSVEFVPVGSTFNDPGCIADENGVDISDAVKITGNINTATIGIYTLTYTAYNADNFPKSESRKVVVYDNTASPLESGVYIVSAASNRNGTTIYNAEFPIVIYQTAPGIFYVSDLFGGYYDQRAGYGSDYAMVGRVALNPDNTISLINSKVAGWGDSLDGMSNGTYDAATKTVTWTAAYAGLYNFNVITVKK